MGTTGSPGSKCQFSVSASTKRSGTDSKNMSVLIYPMPSTPMLALTSYWLAVNAPTLLQNFCSLISLMSACEKLLLRPLKAPTMLMRLETTRYSLLIKPSPWVKAGATSQ